MLLIMVTGYYSKKPKNLKKKCTFYLKPNVIFLEDWLFIKHTHLIVII